MRRYHNLSLSIFLLLLSVNPLTEHVEYSDVIVFMLTHYAIFASGLLLLRTVRANALLILPSALIAALWHLPLPFYLSHSSLFTDMQWKLRFSALVHLLVLPFRL